MLKVVVFIKQVPDTTDVKWTKDNNVDRTNMDSILNPVDRQAIEVALNLKKKYDAEIVAVTMGPKKSLEILKEAIALGVDDAFLLCDSKFAGSDTWATSNVLAAAVKQKISDVDLILFGQSAIDGETSQTGPSTAVKLDLPFVGNVNEIIDVEDDFITFNSETEDSVTTYKMKKPCVLCINNYINKPRIPKIDGYIKAQEYNYNSYNLCELNLEENQTGVKGSPTYVSSVYKTEEKRNCTLIDANEQVDYASYVIDEIKKALEN